MILFIYSMLYIQPHSHYSFILHSKKKKNWKESHLKKWKLKEKMQ